MMMVTMEVTMTHDAANAGLIIFAVVYFLPIFLLGLRRPSVLGCLVVFLNFVALPTLLLGFVGILIWVLAFLFALVDRSERRNEVRF